MSHRDDELPSIDPSALDDVTGGTGTTTKTTSNDDVTKAIQSLSTTLQDFISSRKNDSSNIFTQMLPFLLMMGGGGGFGGCAGACGCGGRGCGRCRR